MTKFKNKIQSYNVKYEICRIEQNHISVDATSEEDAKEQLWEMYSDGELLLNSDEPEDFHILSIKEKEVAWWMI